MQKERNTRNFVNELPKDTGLKNMQHCKICISDVFPDKFCEITNSYIRKLQWVLNRYDVVIFMARKAICFYKALCLNDELQPPSSCEIYSSRVLSYNVWKRLEGKRVALVDDVVIRGGSLATAKCILESHDIFPDIYISALMYQVGVYDYSRKTQFWYDKLNNSIQQPFVFLNETDIYSYANYITRFIEASMLPYNIDQPTALVEYKKEQLDTFMHEHRLTDITSSIQKRFGIKNKVIHYNGEILRPILGSIQISLNEICIKLRIFHDIDSCQLLVFPIIIFPVISKDIVNHVYEHIRTEKLDQLIYNENFQVQEENKTKILIYVLNHYILSRFLWCEREHGRNFVYSGLDSNESILFSESILDSNYAKSTLRDKIAKLTMPYKWEQKTSIRPTFFNEYLGAAYAAIFSRLRAEDNEKSSICFIDAEGKEIKKKIFTLQFFYEKLKGYAELKQAGVSGESSVGSVDDIDICIVSNIIDVLIDRGILVPEIVHTHCGGIIRAYRCGEVAKLNEIEFELFSYMLKYYTTHVWQKDTITTLTQDTKKSISKREAEQLCVLFFRKAAKTGLFEQINGGMDGQHEEDYYSIYYSLFGPTVSRKKGPQYEVNEKDELITVLTTYGYIENNKIDRYTLGKFDYSKLDKKWKRFAEIFANEMLFLKRCFPSLTVRNDYLRSNSQSEDASLQKHVFSKVRSFEELLTLMSIGENEMQRTLSIVAEIKVIADMKTEKISAALSYFMNHMGCIWEGIWKSSCYVNPDLLENIQEVLIKGKNFRDESDLSRIFQEYVDGSSRLDRNRVISDFLEQCGEFFYRTYYTVCIINKYSQDKVNLDAKCKIPNRFKYEKQYKDLWNKIETKYKGCTGADLVETALNDFIELQREAMAILDICDLYFEHIAFGYETYPQSIIVCANNSDLLTELRLASRDCLFRQAKTGKLGDNRFFRCFLVDKNISKSKEDVAKTLSYNLDVLVASTLDIEKSRIEKAEITVIYYVAQRWYEALVLSGNTCAGKFIETLLNDVTRLERKWHRNSEFELFVCGTPEGIETEISPAYSRLIPTNRTGILQNYSVSNYGIHVIAVKNKTDGNIYINGEVKGNVIGTAQGCTLQGSTI